MFAKSVVVMAAGMSVGVGAAQGPALRSGESTLVFSGTAHAGVMVRSGMVGAVGVVVDEPVRVMTCRVQGSGEEKRCVSDGGASGFGDAKEVVEGKYDAVRQDSATQITATAALRAGSGAAFAVEDVYRVAVGSPDVFTMSRTVKVTQRPTAEMGFNSQYSVAFEGGGGDPAAMHFFAPALWYDRNAHAAGMGTEFDRHDYFYWCETRSSLPLVMMQEDASGTAVMLAHVGDSSGGAPVVRSGAEERGRAWMVDAAEQFGSLGVQKAVRVGQARMAQIGFVYPAEEGDVTYGGGAGGWSRRSHPVEVGVAHAYTLAISVGRYGKVSGTGADFPAAMRGVWRRSFDLFRPVIAPDVTEAVWKSNLQLLETTFSEQGPERAPGFPFKIGNLRTGEDDPYSYQMGFVGQQIPLAFVMWKSGLSEHDAAAAAKGKEMLDWWATEDGKAAQNGLPMTWYQPLAPEAKRWSNVNCNRPLFLRSLSDGMEGMAQAILFAKTQGRGTQAAPAAWERFAVGFADWLVKHQGGDGSFQRAFNPDGTVWTQRAGCTNEADAASKSNTPFPIRFLVMMWFATGNSTYKNAAMRAGDWAYGNVYMTTNFLGGVTNRNALDKEAGAEALEAALALYDLNDAVGDQTAAAKWLGAAEMAADYLETWQYAWDFADRDLTEGKLYRAYTYAGTRANSFIGTGGSATDIFLAIGSFDFFRLHLLAGEPANGGHYGRFAELLANNTALTTQLSAVPAQRFGWKYDGMTGEAINLSNMEFRAEDVPLGWLAWISNSQINPMERLEDAFGSRSVTHLLREEQSDAGARAKFEKANHAIYATPVVGFASVLRPLARRF